MGGDFRPGHMGPINSFVLRGKRTIKNGEAAVIWDSKGVRREVVGPSTEQLWFSTICFLKRHKAERDQYLVVRHRDGKLEHKRGPCFLFENPELHSRVAVSAGTRLMCKEEHILVYNTETKGFCVVRGPGLFIPEVNEQLVPFAWSALCAVYGTLYKRPGTFTVLNSGRSSWSVPRLEITNRDAGGSLKVLAQLVFEYDVESVPKVAAAKDPIAKLYTALVADAQRVGATASGEQLCAETVAAVTARLASLETFESLCAEATKCGFMMRSVRVRGIRFSETETGRRKASLCSFRSQDAPSDASS